MPRRHQKPPRGRLRGWNKPPDSRVVTRPSVFSNPYKVEPHGPYSQEEAVERFRRDLLAGRLVTREGRPPIGVDDVRRELAGLDLVCVCPLDIPCHADVLLEVANTREV